MDINTFTALTKRRMKRKEGTNGGSMKNTKIMEAQKQQQEDSSKSKTPSQQRGTNSSNGPFGKLREAERKAYEELQESLPILSRQRRATRLETLTQASSYIHVLQEMLIDLDGGANCKEHALEENNSNEE